MKQFKPITRYSLLLLLTGLLLSGLGLILGGWKDLEQVREERYQVQTVELGTIKKINSSATLNIRTGNVPTATLYYQMDKKYGEPIAYDLVNGELTIKNNNEQLVYFGGVLEGLFALQGSQLQTYQIPTLVLPTGSHLEELTGQLYDGSLNIEQIDIDRVDLEISNGYLSAKQTTFHSTNLTVSDGEIDLQEVKLENTNVSSSDQTNYLTVRNGNITATGLQLIGSYEVTTYDGDIDLTLHKENLKDLAIENRDSDEELNLTTRSNQQAKNKLVVYSENGTSIIK